MAIGSIYDRPDKKHYVVCFSNLNGKRYFKSFFYKTFGTKEEAYRAAEKHKNDLILKYQKIINRHWYNENEQCICMELTQNKIVKFDQEDLDKIKKYRWYVIKTSDNRWFAVTKNTNGNTALIFMHRFLMEKNNLDNIQYVFHIDGNTLNNQKSNLKSGIQRDDSNSGEHYIYWYEKTNIFQFEIRRNGKRYQKNFPINERINPIDAYCKAIRFRNKILEYLNIPIPESKYCIYTNPYLEKIILKYQTICKKKRGTRKKGIPIYGEKGLIVYNNRTCILKWKVAYRKWTSVTLTSSKYFNINQCIEYLCMLKKKYNLYKEENEDYIFL